MFLFHFPILLWHLGVLYFSFYLFYFLSLFSNLFFFATNTTQRETLLFLRFIHFTDSVNRHVLYRPDPTKSQTDIIPVTHHQRYQSYLYISGHRFITTNTTNAISWTFQPSTYYYHPILPVNLQWAFPERKFYPHC